MTAPEGTSATVTTTPKESSTMPATENTWPSDTDSTPSTGTGEASVEKTAGSR